MTAFEIPYSLRNELLRIPPPRSDEYICTGLSSGMHYMFPIFGVNESDKIDPAKVVGIVSRARAGSYESFDDLLNAFRMSNGQMAHPPKAFEWLKVMWDRGLFVQPLKYGFSISAFEPFIVCKPAIEIQFFRLPWA